MHNMIINIQWNIRNNYKQDILNIPTRYLINDFKNNKQNIQKGYKQWWLNNRYKKIKEMMSIKQVKDKYGYKNTN